MMCRLRNLLLCVLLPVAVHAQYNLQTPTDFIKSYSDLLASPGMYGRGYVREGREKACVFLQRKFSEFGLKHAGKTGSFVQSYSFPVNTFPGRISLIINGNELTPAVDYLVDAGSASYSGRDKKVKKLDMDEIADSATLARMVTDDDQQFVYLLENADSFCAHLHLRPRDMARILPDACYIIRTSGKLTWTVSKEQHGATIFQVKEDALPRRVKTVTAEVLAKLLPQYKNENIIGMMPGVVKDTFLVFSAHYDHLGMMGDSAIFPGASDNASGTSMLLYLASYFAKHPTHYSMLFIAFSGEEAGLMGSAFYVAHPAVPLEQIKFLVNVDIMGDATDGVTVVNATEFPQQFSLLDSINKANSYLPVIKTRGKAANSDHYHFSEAGVPAFFLYSNGGEGYYHDIFDKPGELSYKNVEGVVKLLVDFAKGL